MLEKNTQQPLRSRLTAVFIYPGGILKIRRWLHILHRDIGYLAVGLTIIFSVSGIAVNHIHDWNPNYKIIHQSARVKLPVGLSDTETGLRVFQKLMGKVSPSGVVRVAPRVVRVFWDKNKMDIHLDSGLVQTELVESRPFLRVFNRLHLNEPKKAWTYISDLFAVSLVFLAVSGMFLLKGKKGIRGRGTVLVLAGVFLPLLILFLYS